MENRGVRLEGHDGVWDPVCANFRLRSFGIGRDVTDIRLSDKFLFRRPYTMETFGAV